MLSIIVSPGIRFHNMLKAHVGIDSFDIPTY